MKIVIKNARLSFPNLFKASSYEGSEPKFSAALILDRKENAADIKAIENAIAEQVKEHFKGNTKALKGTCLRDGAEKVDPDGEFKDGYGPDVVFVSASNRNRPQVVDRNKSPLTAEDGKPYAGCYVNAVITLWAQNNNFGKRVNANLLAVQFAKDGEPFGDSKVNVDEVFDDLAEDDPSGDSSLLD